MPDILKQYAGLEPAETVVPVKDVTTTPQVTLAVIDENGEHLYARSYTANAGETARQLLLRALQDGDEDVRDVVLTFKTVATTA